MRIYERLDPSAQPLGQLGIAIAMQLGQECRISPARTSIEGCLLVLDISLLVSHQYRLKHLAQADILDLGVL